MASYLVAIQDNAGRITSSLFYDYPSASAFYRANEKPEYTRYSKAGIVLCEVFFVGGEQQLGSVIKSTFAPISKNESDVASRPADQPRFKRSLKEKTQ